MRGFLSSNFMASAGRAVLHSSDYTIYSLEKIPLPLLRWELRFRVSWEGGDMPWEESLLGLLPAEEQGLPFLNVWVWGRGTGVAGRSDFHAIAFLLLGIEPRVCGRSFQARGEEPDHVIGLGEACPGEAAELGEDPTRGPDRGGQGRDKSGEGSWLVDGREQRSWPRR